MGLNLLDALTNLEKEKGIKKDVLIEAIEAALISAYKKNFNTAQNVRVNFDKSTGEIKVFARKTIVEEVSDPRLEISLDLAKEINRNYQIDDIIEIEVTPKEFGRIAAQAAKQVVTQRIREAERDIIYGEFINQEDEIVNGTIQRQDNRFYYVDIGKTEGLLPVNEILPTDNVYQGKKLKMLITKVEKTTKGPQIFLSRTHSNFLKRLFEIEVPEIYEGIVEIKSVSREAGYRSKIAVHSRNKEVDPIGACVGPKGMRVQNIVNELNGEKIDIVKWSEDPVEYISNALSPAIVLSVEVIIDKVAKVIVPDNQLSLAIGKAGQNARLAAKLCNWKIDIKSESQINN